VHSPGPLVGLIRNPLSHRNAARSGRPESMPGLIVRVPRSHEELREALAELAARRVEYLAVEGGDGTMRDVLSCGADIFGESWPAVIVLPRGKTNALAVDIGLPRDWSLARGLEAAREGEQVIRRPLRIVAQDAAQSAGPTPQDTALRNALRDCIQGFFLGAGAFTRGTHEGQAVHRLALFDSLAVAVIVLWSVLQIVFGGTANRWRRTTPMQLRHLPDGTDLPHGGIGNPDERFLMVATAYRRFPLGARPFGRNPGPGLKLGLIDWPRRWLLALLPLIVFGFHPHALARFGMHRLRAEAIEMEIGDSFIVDGETFPPGRYLLSEGPPMRFVVP